MSMFLFQRLRQFWQALTQDESESAIEAKLNVRLQRAVQGLHNVFQKHQLQPGIDYSIRQGNRRQGFRSQQAIAISLDSPRANQMVRSNPEVRAAFDNLLRSLGDIDGQAGYPCRLPQFPAYIERWKQASRG
ncbi:hypothetical protein [Baaleninema simplex]|uniref:hypothetical protein n=1 Tax=Baaleninema simplex TaxID=2862350 RepID=UPI00034CECA8|nr:hypothetical protein [Baaleninema simplex]